MSQQVRRSKRFKLEPPEESPAVLSAECSSCKDPVESPVTCTSCKKYFCWKCFDVWLSFTPRTVCPVCISVQKKQIDSCLHHDLELNLFCLTCNTRICGGCFLNMPEHKRHVIDNLDDVYREKLTAIEAKLMDVGTVLNEFSLIVEQSEFNEQLIQQTEDTIKVELNQLVEKSKEEISKWKEEKMLLCKLRKDAPKNKQTLFKELQKKVGSMAKHELIQQQADLENEATALVPNVLALHPPAINHYDYECSLVPRCNMVGIVLHNFARHLEDSKYEVISSIDLSDSSETFWEVRICNGKHLTIEFSQKQQLKLRLYFEIFIEVLHDNIHKTLRITHKTQNNSDRVEAIEMEMLKEQGFITESDELRLRFGIKPLNIAVERQAVAMNLLDVKKALFELDNVYKVATKKLNETERFTVGYFRIPLDKLQFPEDGTIYTTICIRSHDIKDFKGRSWCLYIDREKANKTCTESYMCAYIRLNCDTEKLKLRRRYYVELINQDRLYSIRKYGIDRFDARTRFGWSPFVKMSRVFADNAGFVKNGHIRFRFGVSNPKAKLNNEVN